MTLPLSYSRPFCETAKIETRKHSSLAFAPSFEFPVSSFEFQTGGQGRVRTSVDHRGRQIYSLLLLTTQPPVRSGILPSTLASAGTVLLSIPENRFHLSQVGSICGWARDTPLPARAILSNPDLVNPLPNLPTATACQISCD